MSNFLAVATVTATLEQSLSGAVAVVAGAKVTTDRPDGQPNGDAADPHVNIFLYHVTPNAAWRNADLPTRREDGTLVERPLTAIDVHYLFSFYGDEGTLEPQRLLGSVVSAMHARPVLDRGAIQTVRDAADDVDSTDARFYLGSTNLDRQVELVSFTPLALGLDDLSKLWSIFFQTPYALSVAYRGSVVLIEAEESPARALPVLERNVYALPFRRPHIERVSAAAGPRAPILAESTVALSGVGLGGDDTVVTFDGIEAEPSSARDAEATVVLPAGLRAGVRSAQLVRRLLLGTPPSPHRGDESNAAPFVLSPEVREDSGAFAVTLADVEAAPDGTVSATVTVGVRPDVGPLQRALLLLTGPGGGYSFEAAARTDDVDTLEFPVARVEPGTYLLRVAVNGAESPLVPDPAGGFAGPEVTFP